MLTKGVSLCEYTLFEQNKFTFLLNYFMKINLNKKKKRCQKAENGINPKQRNIPK